ncbi:hypothetical protein TWF696_004609 [Orbilia brochopaga]|uniref:Uncharacterized protein n=1 Tax=Orbilia brochopaga TaxID=3140254 RepID=A0AAV9V919_9PEZI
MLILGILAIWLSLRGVNGLAIPDEVVEFGTDGTLQMTKRALPGGYYAMELGWSHKSRFHPDHVDPETGQKRSLAKRQADLLAELTDEDRKWFTDNFFYDCGRGRRTSTVPEAFAASRAIELDQDRHDLPGWSVAGIFTLGNQLNDPKKWADCTNIHCLSASPKASGLQLCPLKKNVPFTYGFSISRETVSQHLRYLTSVCSHKGSKNQWASNYWAAEFSWSPKQKEYDNMVIRASSGYCRDWLGPVCRSTDDRSHSQCLALKKLYGINWTEPTPTKATPGSFDDITRD